jgi:hypothetical protein
MSRTPRRIIEPEPGVTTPEMALRYELTASWPPDGSRRRFWTGDAVPDELHEVQRPDPRMVLGDEGDRLEYARAVAFWNEARLLWLRGEVHG